MATARSSFKDTLVVSKLTEPTDDRTFWWSQTPDARLAALETMRQTVYGYDPASSRLQRLLELAAAPYSVRARRGAPVSAPCSWAEVESGTVTPRSVTLRTMPRRVQEIGDLWEPLLAGRRRTIRR